MLVAGCFSRRSSIRLVGIPAPAPRLRGRETEVAVLGEALDRVASGSQAIVLVEGEAGIGKSRLLDQALADAAARGMQIAAGRAEEMERARPFGLLAGAFGCVSASADPQRVGIAGLLSAGGAIPVTVTSDPGLQFRVIDAFGDLAEGLALSGPVVIGVDDLQWADPSSLVALAAMGRRLADLPVGIIGCLRPAPRTAELDGAVRALETAGARHLALPPLSTEAVTDLVSETVAAMPGPGLMAEISGAAGNPLFVTELLAALAQEGAIQVEGGQADVAEPMLPPTLRLTILRRLSFLPDDAVQLLGVASVLGSAFSLTDLALISGRPVAGLATALADAIRARVVEDDGVQLRFRHDLIHDSIYQDLPASVRRGLHREAALRLAHSGGQVLRVAEHFARGATESDGEAITWLTKAAREAAPRSPAVAASLLERAISLGGPEGPDHGLLSAERAGYLMLSGRIADAEAACRALLDGRPDPAAEVAARMCLGRALLAQGREREGLSEMERLAAAPGPGDAVHDAARASASFARLSLGDLDGAESAARQVISTASPAGAPLPASLAMTSLALVRQSRAQLDDALQIADDAARLTDQSPDRQGSWYVHIARANILVALDRLADARAALRASQQTYEELGIRWPLPSVGMSLGLERFMAGEWDDALAELESSLDLAAETGETYSVPYAHSLISLISFHRNELDRAAACAEAAFDEFAGRGAQYRTSWAARPRALVLAAGGQREQALQTMIAAWHECSRLGIAVEHPALGADLVRLAMAEGDVGLARQAASAVADIASRNNVGWLRGAALHCQGLAQDDAGLLDAAVDVFARGTRPLDLALASEDAATALIKHGDPGSARRPLGQAISIYERLGASRDLARAEALLRQAGIRRGVRGARNRPGFGWDSLTPTELTVAGLVAGGLSNPQIGERLFISRRTVQAHLAHVFAKLGISSRTQLAAEVARRRQDTTAPGDG